MWIKPLSVHTVPVALGLLVAVPPPPGQVAASATPPRDKVVAWISAEAAETLPRAACNLAIRASRCKLVNRGNATAAELAELARVIQGRVQSEFGLILQPEPVLVNVEL